MIGLSNYVALYIPTKFSMEVQGATTDVTASVGGCTITRGWGTWRNNKGQAEHEEVTIIKAFCTAQDKAAVYRIFKSWASILIKYLGEECAAIEHDGHMDLLYEKDVIDER